MEKSNFIKIIAIILLLNLSPTLAQSPKTEIEYPSFWDLTPPSDFAGWVAYVVKLLLLTGILLAVLQIVWAGVKYTSSSVDPSQKQDAKDRLKYAIIGLILLFSFFVILQTMNQGLARIALKTPPTPTGKWEIDVPQIAPYIPGRWSQGMPQDIGEPPDPTNTGVNSAWISFPPEVTKKQWDQLYIDLEEILGCLAENLPKSTGGTIAGITIPPSAGTILSISDKEVGKLIGDPPHHPHYEWCGCGWSPKEHKCEGSQISCHYGGDKYCQYRKSLAVDIQPFADNNTFCQTTWNCAAKILANRFEDDPDTWINKSDGKYTQNTRDVTVCKEEAGHMHISIGTWPAKYTTIFRRYIHIESMTNCVE